MFFKKRRISPNRIHQIPHHKKRFSKKRLRVLYVLVGLLIVAILGIFLTRGNFLKVNQITTTPNQLSCTNQEEINNFLGLNREFVFNIDREVVSQKLKDKFLCIGEVTMESHFTGRVHLNIKERTPIAALKVHTKKVQINLDLNDATASSQAALLKPFNKDDYDNTQNFLVDNEEKVYVSIGDLSTVSLPIVNFFDYRITLGEKMSDHIIGKILAIQQKFNQTQLPINEIKVINRRVVVSSTSEVTLSLDKDIEQQLIALQLILTKAKLDSQTVKSVDLRFDKAVVVYNKS